MCVDMVDCAHCRGGKVCVSPTCHLLWYLSYKRVVIRTRREDWLERGFVILREGGEAALTIDRLCRDLGRTKGAFYHHFADVRVYTDALLAAWEEINTSIPSLRTELVSEHRGKRSGGEDGKPILDIPLDRSFRAWGLRDPRAHAFVARIDERRITYLVSLYPSVIPLAIRRKAARLEYATFVGVQQLYPDMSVPAAREMDQMLRWALKSVVGRYQRDRGTARPAARAPVNGHRRKLG
jgi:AcrR family transcriptional regulator